MSNIDLFTRLSLVKSFTVSLQWNDQEQAQGKGIVEVEIPSQSELIWREAGSWQQGLKSHEFSNVYRWHKFDQSKLILEHLRYGDKHPVQLVELELNQHNIWSNVEPHLCRKDKYSLQLDVNDRKIVLFWQIEGPEKRQVSTICYR